MQAAHPTPQRLLRVSTLIDMLQRSRASINRDIQRGEFPKPLKQGKPSRWTSSEVLAHIGDRSQARFDEE